ncbi:MAG: hypothetical protein ABI721_01685 [Candidatus Dojkabacteria bacterium]
MNKKVILGLCSLFATSILCCGVIVFVLLYSADLIGPKANMRVFRNTVVGYENSTYNCIYELSRLISSPPKREIIEDRLNLCKEESNRSLELLAKIKSPSIESQYFLDLTTETLQTYKSKLEINYPRIIESKYSDTPQNEEDKNIGIENLHDSFRSSTKVFDEKYLND